LTLTTHGVRQLSRTLYCHSLHIVNY